MGFQARALPRVFFLFALILQSAWVPSANSEEAPQTRFSEERSAYGKKSGVHYELGPSTSEVAQASEVAPDQSADHAGFYAALNAVLFGKDRSILEAGANVTNLLEGETDFYWGGFRVWNTKPEFKNGAFQVSAGLPTVSMRAPIFGIPIGPITLRLDAGIAAEAEVTAKLIPLLSIPIQFSSIRGEFSPKINSCGFLEGYAKWTILRAGIGGSLELVRANAKVAGQVNLNGTPPSFTLGGFVSLLAGKIYGFVDYFNIFAWKWKRALKPIISDWKGKCFAFPADAQAPGNGSAGGDACVTRP